MLCIDGLKYSQACEKRKNFPSDKWHYCPVLTFLNRHLFQKIADITGTILFYGKLLKMKYLVSIIMF